MGGAINNRMGCDGHVLRFWTGWLVFFFFLVEVVVVVMVGR